MVYLMNRNLININYLKEKQYREKYCLHKYKRTKRPKQWVENVPQNYLHSILVNVSRLRTLRSYNPSVEKPSVHAVHPFSLELPSFLSLSHRYNLSSARALAKLRDPSVILHGPVLLSFSLFYSQEPHVSLLRTGKQRVWKKRVCSAFKN